MTDVADPKYVTVGSVAQDPDDAQYESFMSQLSVEPDDNEQASKIHSLMQTSIEQALSNQ